MFGLYSIRKLNGRMCFRSSKRLLNTTWYRTRWVTPWQTKFLQAITCRMTYSQYLSDNFACRKQIRARLVLVWWVRSARPLDWGIWGVVNTMVTPSENRKSPARRNSVPPLGCSFLTRRPYFHSHFLTNCSSASDAFAFYRIEPGAVKRETSSMMDRKYSWPRNDCSSTFLFVSPCRVPMSLSLVRVSLNCFWNFPLMQYPQSICLCTKLRSRPSRTSQRTALKWVSWPKRRCRNCDKFASGRVSAG